MSNQKFFSGLTEGMMNRAKGGPDRQKSNIFWPDECDNRYNSAPVKQNKSAIPKSKSIPAHDHFDHSTPTLKELQRKQQNSTIQFMDDPDSSFSHYTKNTQKNHLAEFFKPNDVEEIKTRKTNTLQSNIKFYDFGENGTQNIQNNTSAPLEHQSSNGVEYHYSSRYTGSYETANGAKTSRKNSLQQELSSPTRSMSLTETTLTPKPNSFRHLKSSINFYDGSIVTDDSVSQDKKPQSVRDSATKRVGVGLPNL